MTIRIIRAPISRTKLIAFASEQFGDMTKAVVDLARGIMALGGELHSDEESLLLEDGSQRPAAHGASRMRSTARSSCST